MRGPLRSGVMICALVSILAAPRLFGQDLGTAEQREAGRKLYGKYCAQCHGESGDGMGYAAGRVKPAPRDFTAGKYKIRTTPSGRLPTDADLRKVIRDGLPYTSMPAWPNFTDQQVQNLIYHLKTYYEDFNNPEMIGEPIEIPQPLPSTEESIQRGKQIYEELGCAACHGEGGRGDGTSAPTLRDDWGNHIKPADLTQRWTFRGGPTKRDIFRTFSTGLNGTPMPSYADSLEVEDRLHLVNFIVSLGDGDDPGYDTLLRAVHLEDEIDLSGGIEEAITLFEGAPVARFPLVGQIMQPGRDFYPPVTSIEVQAVYNRKEIAFLVRWDDMRAETSGTSSPTLEVPLWDEQQHPGVSSSGGGGDEGGDEGGFFGEAESNDDFFGGQEEAPAEEDFWGEAETSEGGDDFFGEAEGGGDEFWGGAEGAGATTPETEFSDAVAIQFPSVLPSGNRKPYFLLGDSQSRVDLWFLDLGRGLAQVFTGRGSSELEPSDVDVIEVASGYQQGRWSAIFKRDLRSSGGINFSETQFTPLAFSVWDGFNRERGNKRALSAWFYVYTEPAQQQSALVPMLRVALLVLLAEIVFVWVIRRRYTGQEIPARASSGAVPESGAAS